MQNLVPTRSKIFDKNPNIAQEYTREPSIPQNYWCAGCISWNFEKIFTFFGGALFLKMPSTWGTMTPFSSDKGVDFRFSIFFIFFGFLMKYVYMYLVHDGVAPPFWNIYFPWGSPFVYKACMHLVRVSSYPGLSAPPTWARIQIRHAQIDTRTKRLTLIQTFKFRGSNSMFCLLKDDYWRFWPM